MIEVEVFGVEASTEGSVLPGSPGPPGAREEVPELQEIQRLCALAAGSAGVCEGHVAIEFVDERRIAELNRLHRDRPKPTDVLSFPIDGAEPAHGERELGDVVICLRHTSDVREAIVHGVLHLVGMDHETDGGEMLQLQRELLRGSA
jgi:probable rRNA maturation factor